MQKVLNFRAQIKALKDEGNALLGKVETEKRAMTAEEQTRFDAIGKEMDSLEKRLDDYIKVNRISEEELRGGRMTWDGIGNGRGETAAMSISVAGATDRSYRGMFHGGDKHKTLDRGGFESLDEFLRLVGSKRSDPRLDKRAMTVGVPSEGGFSVPESYVSDWLDASLEAEVIRPQSRVYPMTSMTLSVPGWDDLDHSTGKVFGGFEIAWLAEGATATLQKAKTRKITFTARKGGIFVKVTRELLQDGLNFASELSGALKRGLGYGLDDAFINGVGGGQPLGILNATSLITVAKESGQTADTICFENCIKMLGRLHPSAVIGACWVANTGCLTQLMMLTQPIGTGGEAIKALTRQGNQYMLFDRPLYLTEKCPALGDPGDLILADLSKFAIGLRQDLAVDASTGPGFMEDETTFRVIVRVDAMPVWDKAFTPKSGATQSWAVALAAR